LLANRGKIPIFFVFVTPCTALGATKGTVMDRYISINTRTMNSVSSVSRFERVVGVAIMRVSALLHARALSWRWTPSGLKASPEAAAGFAQA
jgi:hypothetical protein